MSALLRLAIAFGKSYLESLMADKHPYSNAIRILEFETKIAQQAYEGYRDVCLGDKEMADKAQEKYDLAVELRHATNVLRESKPSGIL